MSTASGQEEPITYDSILRLIKQHTLELQQSSAEFDRRIAEERKLREESFAASFAAEEKRRKKSEADYEKWKKEMQTQIGGIGKSNGEYAEQFFFRSLKRTKTFGGIEYNEVTPNWAKSKGGIDEEYDIIMHNGDSLVLIEVKYKFKMNELKTFACRKAVNFRKLYPEYSDKKIYLGIAGCSFDKDVAETARAMGIGILHKDGKNVEYNDANLKAF